MSLSSRHSIFVCFTLSVLFLMAHPMWALIKFALDPSNDAASQIVLIPFVSAFLIYRNRKSIFQTVRYSVFSGVGVSVLGIGLFIVASKFGAQLVEDDRLALATSSFVVLWLGGFLLFYGPDVFRRALFPLLFLAFCIPIPSPVLHRVISALQTASAGTSVALLKLTGTPVYRDGFVLAMPGLVIDVAPECSGIRSSIGVVILSLLAGHFLLRLWWHRVVLLITAMPIVVLKNAIRIDTLSLLTIHVDRTILQSRLHQEGGFVFFFLALLLLYPILTMLVKSEIGADRLVVKKIHHAARFALNTPPKLGGEHSEGINL